LEHEFYFSIYWEETSQLTFIFFRGVGQPPTSDVISRWKYNQWYEWNWIAPPILPRVDLPPQARLDLSRLRHLPFVCPKSPKNDIGWYNLNIYMYILGFYTILCWWMISLVSCWRFETVHDMRFSWPPPILISCLLWVDVAQVTVYHHSLNDPHKLLILHGLNTMSCWWTIAMFSSVFSLACSLDQGFAWPDFGLWKKRLGGDHFVKCLAKHEVLCINIV
jgi:hypothetical protein